MDNLPVILHFRAPGPTAPAPSHVFQAALPAVLLPSLVAVEFWPEADAPAGCLPLPCAPGWSIALVVRPLD